MHPGLDFFYIFQSQISLHCHGSIELLCRTRCVGICWHRHSHERPCRRPTVRQLGRFGAYTTPGTQPGIWKLQRGDELAAARRLRPSSVNVVILIKRIRHGKLPIAPSLPYQEGNSTETDNPHAAHYKRMELKLGTFEAPQRGRWALLKTAIHIGFQCLLTILYIKINKDIIILSGVLELLLCSKLLKNKLEYII